MNKSTLGAIIMTTAIIAGAAELSREESDTLERLLGKVLDGTILNEPVKW